MSTFNEGAVAALYGPKTSYSYSPLDRAFFGAHIPRPPTGSARAAIAEERVKWLQAALVGMVKEARQNPAEIWAELTMTEYGKEGPDTALDDKGNTALHWVLDSSSCSVDLLPHRRAFLESCEVLHEVMASGGTPDRGNAAGITPIELCQDLATLACLCYYTKSRRPDLMQRGSETRRAFAERYKAIRCNR